MRDSIRNTSLLKKINVTNSIVITSACILIFFCFWFVNYRMMIRNEQQVIENSMKNSICTLEDKLKDMSRVSLVCYSDNNIQQILEEYDGYDQIQKVYAEKYLSEFYTSLITIRNDVAGVYLFTTDQLIYYSDYTISSVDWRVDVTEFLNTVGETYENKNGEPVKLISNKEIPFVRYKAGESSEDYLYMMYPVRAFSPNVKIGYIMLSIAKEKIENIIRDYMKENSGFMLLSQENTFILGSMEPDDEILKQMEEKTSDYQRIFEDIPMVSVKDSVYSSMRLVTVTSLDSIQEKYRDILFVTILLLAVMNLAVIGLQSFFIKERLAPLKLLTQSMQRFSEDQVYVPLAVSTEDEIGKLTESFNYMLNVIETLIEKEYKSKEMLQKAEIEQQKMSMLYLKNQINPHFLYNTLDMIRIKARLNNDREVADIIMELVEFYRLNVKADKQIVSIRHEVLLLKKYMNIMLYRYPTLEFGCEIQEDLLDVHIPNFLIQPLVENSLLHGLKNARYVGKISVRIREQEGRKDRIEIIIRDNGVGMSEKDICRWNQNLSKINETTEENVADRIGISNIQKRLQLYYPGEGNILYKKNPENGVTVCVVLLKEIKVQEK